MLPTSQDKNLDFLDIISIMSFVIALQNLDINITQTDMDEQTATLDAHVNKEISRALEDIHGHLSVQDEKLNIIIRLLEEISKK